MRGFRKLCGHGGGHGVHGGRGGHGNGGGWCWICCVNGSLRKGSTVGDVYTTASNLLIGQNSELLTLDQTADVVCTATSEAKRDPSPADSDLSTYTDGDIKGTIQLPPPHNDAYIGYIR